MLCELFLMSYLHMYMTSTLPLFTGDSGPTTPSTQNPVKLRVSHDDQSGVYTCVQYVLHVYIVCLLFCIVHVQYINLLSTVFVVFKEDKLSQATNL